jgi:N-acetyl-anhydromuramyl-L-alanine amidase AmpD
MKINNGMETLHISKYAKTPTNIINKILVHHTGGTDKDPLADTSHHTFAIVKSFHKSKGWDTIGYHFFIEKTGDIWQGRPVQMHGAHCASQNKQSIGVCLAGNFDKTIPTDAQISSLRGLLQKLTQEYTIIEIVPHRKYDPKTCYGKNLSDSWASDLLKETPVNNVSTMTNEELLLELKKRLK